MTTKIHPTAVIDPSAHIGQGVEVGPYALIGPNVILGDRVRVGHGATVEKNTKVGADTRIWPQAAVGVDPQDLKYAGEESHLEIGADCMIREFASLHRGTAGGGMLTRLGDHVLVMNGAHVGHDAQVGNKCILAAHCALGGHVSVGDHAIIGGITAVHQWVRIGAHAMVGLGMLLTRDVPPYGVVTGVAETLAGVNLVGLKRRGFSRSDLKAISGAMKSLFFEREEQSLSDALSEAKTSYADNNAVQALVDFIESGQAQEHHRGFASAR